MQKSFIITGASGFLGSHFLVENLLNRSDNISKIYCLARDTLRTTAEIRVREALVTAARDAGLGDRLEALMAEFDAKCIILRADIEQPECGLESDVLASLRADEMWHFAAMLRFSIKLRRYVNKNIVDGTQNVLAIAKRAEVKAFNYLSTAIVAGNETGFNAETFHESLDSADTSYELAKRDAEVMVRDQCRDLGIGFRVFRPSIVVGHSVTHQGKTDTGFYGLVTICAKLKNEIESKIPGFLSQHPIKLTNTNLKAAMNLIYVDDVIRQLIAIADSQDSLGKIYHIVNKSQLRQDEILSEMETVLRIKVNRVTSVDEFEPLDHLVRKQMGEYEKYFSNYYEFDTRNVDAIIPGDYAHPISRADARSLMEKYYTRFKAEDSRAELFVSPLEGFENKTIQTSDGILSYYVGGNGSVPILIINAYGQSLHFWTELFNLMRDDYRIYLWEIRGTSVVAGGMQGNFTVNDHVADALKILEAEDLEGCNVIGWCTGGKIALELASRAPGRVGRLICLTPSFKGTAGESMDTNYEKSMEPICRAVDRNPAQARLVQEFMGSFFAGADTSDDKRGGGLGQNVRNVLGMVNRNVRPLLVAPFVAESSIVHYSRQLLQFWAHDISALYDLVDAPIMVLSGERDDIADPRLAQKVVGKFANSVGFQVIGGSHYIHKEHSRSVKRMLDAFLEKGLDVLPESERVELMA